MFLWESFLVEGKQWSDNCTTKWILPTIYEWFTIIKTSTEGLVISGLLDASAEGNKDCALGIESFCVHRHIKSKGKTNKRRINKKVMYILHPVN